MSEKDSAIEKIRSKAGEVETEALGQERGGFQF